MAWVRIRRGGTEVIVTRRDHLHLPQMMEFARDADSITTLLGEGVEIPEKSIESADLSWRLFRGGSFGRGPADPLLTE